MKIEDQVCSLELSKRLKELGVKQESYFQWRGFDCGETEITFIVLPVGEIPEEVGIAKIGFGVFAAFTVAELGEILPGFCHSYRFENRWVCTTNDVNIIFRIENEKTEADARAKMLVYLIEQGIVKP